MKKLILLVAAAVLTGGTDTDAAETLPSSYDYTIIDGEATIVGYTGKPVYIDIPGFIEGCPVTEVRDNAFYNCNSLKWIKLPDTVERIGHHSFYACYELETVELPEGLEEIGMGCFCGCASLSCAELPGTLRVLPDSCFRACTSLTDVELPMGLETVDKFCFSGCTELRTVETGDCLVNIGERAFYQCREIETIYIPPTVETIGDEALGYDCDGNLLIKQTDLVITGEPCTAAERYARDNGLTFCVGEPSAAAFAELRTVDDEVPFAAWLGLIFFGTIAAVVLWLVFRKGSSGGLNNDER